MNNKLQNIKELKENTRNLKQRYDDLLIQSSKLLNKLERSIKNETIIHSKQEQNTVPNEQN